MKKITCSSKSQEDLKLSEKGKSIDANTEMTEMLELFDDFKAAIIKCSKEIKVVKKSK